MFQAHRALPSIDRVIEFTFDHGVPCNIEALATDAGTLMTFHHWNLVSPLATTEVAEDVGHVNIVDVGPRLAHVSTLLGEGKKKGPRRLAPTRA